MTKKLFADIPKETIKGKAMHSLADGAIVHRPSAADVTAGTFTVKLSQAPAAVEALVFSAVGTKKAWDGAVSVTGKVVTVNNAGTTDWAAGDRVVIRAYFD